MKPSRKQAKTTKIVDDNKKYSFDIKKRKEMFDHLIYKRKSNSLETIQCLLLIRLKERSIRSGMTHGDIMLIVVLSLKTKFKMH
jgi:hypothetical protein